jgi:hypothetical protein
LTFEFSVGNYLPIIVSKYLGKHNLNYAGFTRSAGIGLSCLLLKVGLKEPSLKVIASREEFNQGNFI